MINNKYREKVNTWPAFVDLFSNLVIILIFLLIVFVFLWTTTSVFNKNTGAKTVAELKQINAEQSERIRQMTADEEEAMRLLILARARVESAENDLESKDLSMIDLITAYENRVTALQIQDEETKQQVLVLREQLNQALTAKQELAELEEQKRILLAETEQKMELQDAQYREELAAQSALHQEELSKLNAALATAEANVQEQEAKYVEMSTKLNKALADKVAELQDMKQYQSEFYKSIKMALGNVASLQPEGDRFIISSDILFPSGAYKLSAEGKNQLRLISNVIKDFESKIPSDVNWIIRIDGHTDSKPVVPGNRAYADNMQLSLLRARAVMNELVHDGVAATRLVPSGFGDLHPISTEPGAAGMQKNRRIELQLTNK